MEITSSIKAGLGIQGNINTKAVYAHNAKGTFRRYLLVNQEEFKDIHTRLTNGRVSKNQLIKWIKQLQAQKQIDPKERNISYAIKIPYMLLDYLEQEATRSEIVFIIAFYSRFMRSKGYARFHWKYVPMAERSVGRAIKQLKQANILFQEKFHPNLTIKYGSRYALTTKLLIDNAQIGMKIIYGKKTIRNTSRLGERNKFYGQDRRKIQSKVSQIADSLANGCALKQKRTNDRHRRDEA